jgi:hypothetical protein
MEGIKREYEKEERVFIGWRSVIKPPLSNTRE